MPAFLWLDASVSAQAPPSGDLKCKMVSDAIPGQRIFVFQTRTGWRPSSLSVRFCQRHCLIEYSCRFIDTYRFVNFESIFLFIYLQALFECIPNMQSFFYPVCLI